MKSSSSETYWFAFQIYPRAFLTVWHTYKHTHRVILIGSSENIFVKSLWYWLSCPTVIFSTALHFCYVCTIGNCKWFSCLILSPGTGTLIPLMTQASSLSYNLLSPKWPFIFENHLNTLLRSPSILHRTHSPNPPDSCIRTESLHDCWFLPQLPNPEIFTR